MLLKDKCFRVLVFKFFWYPETFRIFCVRSLYPIPYNLNLFSRLNFSKGYLILGLHFRFCDDVYDFLYGFDCASKFGHHMSFGTRHAWRLLAKYASRYFRMLNLDWRRIYKGGFYFHIYLVQKFWESSVFPK